MNHLKFVTVCIIFSCLVVGCSDSATEKSDAAVSSTGSVTTMAAKPDMGKLKASIQALENSWATADNARDTNAIAAFYAEDAISYSNNKPMLVGRAAIQKDIAAGIAKRAKGATVACDIMDVFGDENAVTETGKITVKDASGKVTYTGKYVAIWEMRDGNYICVRDISNDDAKEK